MFAALYICCSQASKCKRLRYNGAQVDNAKLKHHDARKNLDLQSDSSALCASDAGIHSAVASEK